MSIPASIPVTIRRAVIAAVAAASVLAPLAGCSVAVPGHAAPVPGEVGRSAWVTPSTGGPTQLPPVGTRPVTPSGSTATAPYARWMAAGWTPQPWLRVTDPGSGASVLMLGSATTRATTGRAGKEQTPTSGTVYEAKGAPAGARTVLEVYQRPANFRPDLAGTVKNYAAARGGTVLRSAPLAVEGNPAVDSSLTYVGKDGRATVAILRAVATSTHLMFLAVEGAEADRQTVAEVADPVFSSLRVRTA